MLSQYISTCVYFGLACYIAPIMQHTIHLEIKLDTIQNRWLHWMVQKTCQGVKNYKREQQKSRGTKPNMKQ
jgi:hypothetical protein